MSKKTRARKAKARQRKNIFIPGNPLAGNLEDRADSAEMIYNTLSDVAPEDVDGIKKAYVNVSQTGTEITLPGDNDEMQAASFYGIHPTSVASLTEPFPLIARSEGPSPMDRIQEHKRSMLRQALRQIVDDV